MEEENMARYPIEQRFIWLNGKMVHVSDAQVNILSPMAQFGANVFEGIRCYWNEEDKQLYAFRLEAHYQRLVNSMKIFRMEDIYPISYLKEALIETIIKNDYREDIAIRQTVFIDGFGTWSSKGPLGMFVSPIPKPRIHFDEVQGIRCGISAWERIDERVLPPRVKVGANYINSRMAQLQAYENGYDMAILMNRQGKISEGPGSCFFIVRDGKLITPPCTASVLESITRATVMVLARDILGIESIEREIDRTELYICEEAFFCGSAVEITPVTSIDGYLVGNGKVGQITMKIHDTYLQVVTGKLEEYKMWLTGIY